MSNSCLLKAFSTSGNLQKDAANACECAVALCLSKPWSTFVLLVFQKHGPAKTCTDQLRMQIRSSHWSSHPLKEHWRPLLNGLWHCFYHVQINRKLSRQIKVQLFSTWNARTAVPLCLASQNRFDFKTKAKITFQTTPNRCDLRSRWWIHLINNMRQCTSFSSHAKLKLAPIV